MVGVPEWARAAVREMALPSADHTLELVTGAPNVLITKTDVIVEGERVASVEEIVGHGKLQRVDGEFERLKALRESWKAAHPGSAFPGVVQFWIERTTSVLVVKAVFQTAAFAGYPNAAFVVRPSGDPKHFARVNVDAQVPGPPESANADASAGGTTAIVGRLPPEVVQRIVRQNFGSYRACYEKGLAKLPTLGGVVRVHFVIGRDGSVTKAEAPDPFPDPKVVACVVRAFQKLSFPAPEGGTVSVVYPIEFSP